EEVARAATRPIWFQLYVEDDRGRTRALIERAEAAGCKALCITVDNPWHYARNRQDRIFDAAPRFPFPNIGLPSRGPGGRGRAGGGAKRFTWKDLEWVQSFAKTPILIEGNPESGRCRPRRGSRSCRNHRLQSRRPRIGHRSGDH